MKNLFIKTASDYSDAIVIARHTAEIWNETTDHEYFDKMNQYIQRFPAGYIIGLIGEQAVASSVAFPIRTIPEFAEINSGNIFDSCEVTGLYYYIHVIQVLEKFQNRGFGIKLLRHQQQMARASDFKSIVGMAVDHKLEMWKRCGFEETGVSGEYKSFGRMMWVKMNID
ncbi:GNAT family N-acetyltransferase [candidate division KSB1 bacterium]|nr:GNAT family N-acetyltransferase [candidate division KSB1 bacterium]